MCSVLERIDLYWPHVPEIFIFMMPDVIYSAIFSFHPETKIIRFPPGLQDRANLDLGLVHEK